MRPVRLSSLLFFAIITVLLFCSQYNTKNPLSPDYVGNYTFALDTAGIHAIALDSLEIFTVYKLPLIHSVDTFAAFTVASLSGSLIDTTLLADSSSRDTLRLLFVRPCTSSVIIGAIRPNGVTMYDTLDVRVVNPYKITGQSNAATGETVNCVVGRLDNRTVVPACSVAWSYSIVSDTLVAAESFGVTSIVTGSIAIAAKLFRPHTAVLVLPPHSVRFAGNRPILNAAMLIDSLELGKRAVVAINVTDVDQTPFRVHAVFENKAWRCTTAVFSFTQNRLCTLSTITDTGLVTMSVSVIDTNSLQSNSKVVAAKIRSLPFTFDYNTLPSAITILSPTNGQGEVAIPVTVSWSGGIDPDRDSVRYSVYYGNSSSSLTNVLPNLTGNTASLIGLVGNQQIFWKVVAYSRPYPADSVSTPLSSFSTFNIPPHAVLNSPSSGATGISLTPTLIYGAQKGDGNAVAYAIWLGKTSSLTSTNQVATALTIEQYPITTALSPATKYYWRIAAAETEGFTHKSDTSAVDSFYTGNIAPAWNLPPTHDTTAYRIRWKLSSYCSILGNPIRRFFKVVSTSAGDSIIQGTDTLVFEADSQQVTVTCIDSTFPGNVVATTVSFRAYRFVDPQMKKVPAKQATFQMGDDIFSYSPAAIPVHTVTFTYSFCMDSTEVTQGNYAALMGGVPARGGNYPVAVSWLDAIKYCNARSSSHGFVPVYTILADSTVNTNFSLNGYRLATEAEWEFAARGGTTTAYYWGEQTDSSTVSQYEWLFRAYVDGSGPVGVKRPNPFGLYDMLGNLMQWCNDWAGPYSALPQENPTGFVTGGARIVRGARSNSGSADIKYARSGARNAPAMGLYTFGFRCVRMLSH